MLLPNASGLISQGFEQQVRGVSEQLSATLQGRAQLTKKKSHKSFPEHLHPRFLAQERLMLFS